MEGMIGRDGGDSFRPTLDAGDAFFALGALFGVLGILSSY